MKALILAAGRGKRMEELSSERNKCLIEVRGRPLIEYSLSSAASIDEVSEIVIVVGYQAETIINRYGTEFRGKKIRYRLQYEQKGLVHAIETSQADIGQEDFFLFLGDEIVLRPRYAEMIRMFHEEKLYVVCGVVRPEDPAETRKTYAVIQGADGQVYRLVEKPERPINDLMGTGNCIFRNCMLEYLPKVPIHHIRKEKELPDFIQCAIDHGEPVKSFLFCDYYINANTLAELEKVQANWPLMAEL